MKLLRSALAGLVYGGLGALTTTITFSAYCSVFLPHFVLDRPFFIGLLQSMMLAVWLAGASVISLFHYFIPTGIWARWRSGGSTGE